MMLPATAFSSSSSSSANSAVVRVDKATSEFLNGPDWTINIDICDTINANHWLAKDVVKALKKRLQHKNPNVQLLSLTLLETMVKNCGENVHFQIAERNILPEMIKIVKKKTDMRVREKILVLLDSWQEAFGGRAGKYPQYYFAYDELRQSGVQFPHRSPDAAPIFTPPVTHRSFGPPQANYGMPSNSSTRLDEAMASEIENLSLSMIESMRNVSDLLSDMLQAVDPNDRMAVKDEVIVDVVDRCRSNQKKLMQMLASTSDEELLGQGIELNDILQSVLAKHDAIASGSPIPLQITGSITPPTDTHKFPTDFSEEKEENSKSSPPPSAPVPKNEPKEEEEDEDDFALLARRHSKAPTVVSQNESRTSSDPSSSMALVPIDPLPPVNTTRADDMIDFLSLTLSSPNTTSPPPPPPPPPSSHPISATSSQNVDQTPPYSAATQSYVVPWAQSSEPQPQLQVPVQPQPRPQPQPQPQYPQQNYSSGYIPPPWAATPGYYTNQYPSSSVPSYTYAAPMPTSSYNNNNIQSHVNNNMRASGGNSNAAAQRPFIPSYRLFEDLNVLGNPKTNGDFSGSTSGQSMMGGKK